MTAPTAADWTILDYPGVRDIIGQVSNTLANTFGGITSADDVAQDASMWAATHFELVQEYLSDQQLGPRALYRRLHDRMFDQLETQASRAALSVPFPDAEGSSGSE